jgi:predicted double-glycine peptidase
MELEKNPKTRPIYRKILSLADKAVGKAFPGMNRVRQITSYHCGPAVIVTLLSFLGVRLSQSRVVKSIGAEMKIKKVGLSIPDLAAAVKTLGKKNYVFWRKANSKISDLEKVIRDYKYPVGVEWQGVFYEFEDEDNGHYSVVTGVDTKNNILRIADPYPEFSGVDRKFDTKFFTKRWWDKNLIKGRMITDKKMMFVVTPKGETWPEKLGMKKSLTY